MTRARSGSTLAITSATGVGKGQAAPGQHRHDHERRRVPGRLLLLHPAVMFGVVWAITFLVWVFSPQSVVKISWAGRRAELTTHAALYLIAGVAAFMVAAVVGSFTDGRRRSRFAAAPETD